MPNHVKNIVKICNIKPEDKADIVHMITSPVEGDPDRIIIDFDKIIPSPATKEECPEKYLITKDSHVVEYEDRPWFNWYDWHIDFWGTKWNAYDGWTETDESSITLVFNTAWAAPMPIYHALAVLGHNLEIKYADEDLGSNCEIVEYDCERDSWSEDHPDDIIETEFAESVWDY